MRTQSSPTSQRPRAVGVIAAAIALLLGALIVQCLPKLPPRWLDVALFVLALAACWRWPRMRWLALLLFGFAWTAWRADLALQSRLPRALEKRDFDVVGVVEGLPRVRNNATGFTLRIERAWLDGVAQPLAGDARVAWYGAPEGAPASCSRWHLRLRLKRPRGLLDPGGFDSERSALERRIVAVGYVRDDGRNRAAAGAAPWCIDGIRARVSAAIAAHVADPHDARLLQALAVGDTRGLDDHDWDVARANGISHLLAISGFHVGVAALFGAWLIYGVWWLWPRLALRVPRPVAQALAALLTATAYGALAGFGLPTERTLLMIAVVALARCSRRGIGGASSLALALTVILLWDPLAVLSAGFWLSFAGVAFLMLGLSRPHGVVAHARALGVTQLLMTVALLPLTVWFFGQASLLGALSNLIAVPWVSLLVVPLALAGTLLLAVSPTAAGGIWQLAAWLMHALWALLEQLAQWPGAHWYLPHVTLGALLLATLGAIWLFLPRGMPARWLGALLFLPLLWPRADLPAPGGFRAVVLDVGQGLSVLVRTRHHALLFDAGAKYPSGFDLGRVTVLPALHALGVRRLDLLMISHGDNDHAGGAPAVAAEYPRAQQLSGEPRRVGLQMQPCRSGQHWSWDGVSVRVLSPAGEGGQTRRGNDRSCVLLVTGQGGRLLLTGDISDRIEPSVARAVGPGAPLVLLVPHHGSKTSSSPAFIEALHPGLAIVSAGWLNRFGHPAASVVARYVGAGVPLLDTATAGAVRVRFPPDAPPWVGDRWRWRDRRYWRE